MGLLLVCAESQAAARAVAGYAVRVLVSTGLGWPGLSWAPIVHLLVLPMSESCVPSLGFQSGHAQDTCGLSGALAYTP